MPLTCKKKGKFMKIGMKKDSTINKALDLHMSAEFDPLSGVIPEHRANYKPWIPPDRA